MRVLVTGATGFAGRYLCDLARDEGAELVRLARTPPSDGNGAVIADLTDRTATFAAVREARPERVFHLAAQASVAESWANPRSTIDANVATTINLLDAVVEEAPDARVLVTGSSEQYGPADPERLPVREQEPFQPQNPYAVSKCATDLLAGFYADARGLDVVRTRSFNHAGPGQDPRYVVASFARQIAAAEASGERSVTVTTGDTRPKRDFTDVRDVVRAYWAALEHAPAGTYNVCSGEARSVGDILAGLAALTDLAVEQKTDPALLRAKEVMEIRGSHDRLTQAAGWEPELPFERTLTDTLDFWRARVGEAQPR